jgi:GWxTD domain-containing protein
MKILQILISIMFLFFSHGKNGYGQEVYFSFDYALFRDPGGESILEVYYSVPQKLLYYEETSSGFEAAVKVDVKITSKLDGAEVASNVYRSPSIVRDTADKNSMQNLVGQVNYFLKPGTYSLTIKGSDFANEEKIDLFETDFIAAGNSGGLLEISDIELSSSIKKSDNTTSTFYKNTLEVIPSPSGLFGKNLADMQFYLEFYELTTANVGDKYSIRYSILSLNRDTLTSVIKNFTTKATSKADYGKFKVDTLPSGSFVLSAAVIGSDGAVKAEQEKKFYVFTKSSTAVEQNKSDGFLTSEYAAMPIAQVDDEFEKMEYVLTDKQSDYYEELKTPDDKRKFIYNFWKARDDKPSTPALESKIAYFKRVNEANQKFEESFKEGWKSDRGRIFILYGKPDDIERYPFETSTKSYEIWKYDAVEGGGECDFVELQPMTGVYWLVNSTFRSELQNQNWREQLNPK